MIKDKNYFLRDGNILTKVFYIPIDYKEEDLIPEGITEIGSECFAGIDFFKEFHIPSSITVIHPDAFREVSHLQKLYIPETVQLIGGKAFMGCPDLEEVYYTSKTNWGKFCFYDCKKLKYLHKNEDTARIFYLPQSHDFALAVPDVDLSSTECSVFKGIFANEGHLSTTIIDYDTIDQIVYFAVVKDMYYNDLEYFWFDTDPEIAIQGAKLQASHKTYTEFFNKKWTLDDYITKSQFKLLIGICYNGANICFRICGEKGEGPLQIGAIAEYSKRIIPIFCERILEALDKQDKTVLATPQTLITWDQLGTSWDDLLRRAVLYKSKEEQTRIN